MSYFSDEIDGRLPSRFLSKSSDETDSGSSNNAGLPRNRFKRTTIDPFTTRHSRRSYSDNAFTRPAYQSDFSEILNITGPQEAENAKAAPNAGFQTVPQTWRQSESTLMGGSVTANLLAICATECYTDKTGRDKITLVCPDVLQGADGGNSSLVHMRWMHLRSSCLRLQTLKVVVADCPFISQRLKAVALAVLEEVSNRFEQTSEGGRCLAPLSIFRAMGRPSRSEGRYRSDPVIDTEPVIFLTTPHLVTHETNPRKRPEDGHYMRTFHQFLFRYESGGARDQPLVIQKLIQGDAKQAAALCVADTWCLVVGSGLVITFSRFSFEDIVGEDIMLDKRGSGTYSVRLIDNWTLRQHQLVIDRDCTYVDFLRRAVALTNSGQTDAEMYELFEEGGDVLTPEKWLNLLASETIEASSLRLREKARSYVYRRGRTRRSRVQDGGFVRGRLWYSTSSSDGEDFYRRRVAKHAPVDRPPSPVKLQKTSPLPARRYGRDKDDLAENGPKITIRHERASAGELKMPGLSTQMVPFSVRPLPPAEVEDSDQTSTASRYYRSSRDSRTNIRLSRYRRATETSRPNRTPELYDVEILEDSGGSTTALEDSDGLLGSEDGEYFEPEGSARYSTPKERRLSLNSRGKRMRGVPGLSKKVHFLPEGGSPSTQSKSFETAAPKIVPFLTWKVTRKNDGRSLGEVEKDLAQILHKLDQSLSSSFVKNLYRTSFHCTLEGLKKRHDYLYKDSAEDGERPTSGPARRTEGEGAAAAAPQSDSPNLEATKGDGEGGKQPQTTGPAERGFMLMARDRTVMRNLIRVSQDLMSSFLPQESPLSMDNVCMRFWGSVDAILRQISWSAAFSIQSQWECCVEDLDSPESAGAASGQSCEREPIRECDDCKRGTGYATADEALCHLHKHHVNCPGSENLQNPSDDPCFVRLQGRTREVHLRGEPRHDKVMSPANQLVEKLTAAYEKVRELHCLVASTTDQQNPTNTRPHLLSSIVYVFEELLSLYMVTARELSLINRSQLFEAPARQNSGISDRIRRARRFKKMAQEKLDEHLATAKRDIIIVGVPSRDIDRVMIASIGPEFLAGALILGLQNRPCHDLAQKKHRLEMRSVIDVYKKYTSHLWFEASRRPRRRGFLEIGALQEELEALRRVTTGQGQVLHRFQKLLSPRSLDLAHTDEEYYHSRHTSFGHEVRLFRRQRGVLHDRNKDLDMLLAKARSLKEEVKQGIEILEEGHGKAIRAFTIVTLFFLPLSFMSSFFGMNASDIRDMQHGQAFFWATALPLTAVVFGLALLYGYKGDEATEAIERAWVPRAREITFYQPGDNGDPLLGVRQGNEDNGEKEKSWFPRRSEPYRSGGGASFRRRQTGDSAFERGSDLV